MSARIPRLDFEALAPKLKAQLEPRVKRLGYLGEFFKCTAHQPELLSPFMTMTEAFKEVLPQRLIEVGALTVAGAMGNAYERHQHERLSEKLGFGRDWIAEVNRLAPDSARHMEHAERAVQRLALAMIATRGHGVAAQVEAVIEVIGPEQTIATMFLVGRYITHALIVNGLELTPPVPSIFEKAVE
jgi:hypothetical protein